jgi:hypothetical protein
MLVIKLLFLAYTKLSSFLKDEIQRENEVKKHKNLPKISGFDVKTDGPNVTLTKSYNDEK